MQNLLISRYESDVIRRICNKKGDQSWEWWISRSMLDLLFFLILRIPILYLYPDIRIKQSGLKVSHSKVPSSGLKRNLSFGIDQMAGDIQNAHGCMNDMNPKVAKLSLKYQREFCELLL